LPALAQTAAEFYERASMAAAQDRLPAAVIELKNALQADPEHLPSRILLGELQARSGDPAAAEKELRRALEMGADPNLVLIPFGYSLLLLEEFAAVIDFPVPVLTAEVEREWQVIRGRALLGANRPEEAFAVFDALLARYPKDVAAMLGKANARAMTLDYAAAAAIADEILAVNERVSSAWKIKGDAARLAGDIAQAATLYARALQIDPVNVAARKEHTLVLLQLERYDEALQEAEQLRFDNPGDPRAELINAWLLAQVRRDEQAQALLEDLSRRLSLVDPRFVERNAQAQLVTGLTLYLEGRVDEALPGLTSYLARRPQNRGVRLLLARVAEQRGQDARLVALLEPIAHDLVGQPRFLSAYVQALLRLDRGADAIALLSEQRAAHPGAATPTELLGRLYATTGRPDDAIRLLQEAGAAGGTRDGARVLGYLLLAQNELAAAAELAERSLAQFPDDAQIASLAGAVYLRRGELDRAEPLLERALAGSPEALAARLNLATLAQARGDLAQAREAFIDISEDFPGNRAALQALSDLSVQERAIPDALRWTEALVAADLADPAAAFRLAGLYLADGRPDDALALISKLEKDYPLHRQLVDLKARAYMANGDLTNARRWLAYLGSVFAAAPDELAEIAALQLAARDGEGAATSIDRLAALEPDSPRVALLRARFDLVTGDGAAAFERLAALDRADPGQVAVKELLMEAAWQQGNMAEFRRAYDQAQRLAPRSARVQGVARRLWQAGDKEGAEQLLRAWLEANPGDVVVRERLAESLIGLQRPAEAYALYLDLLAGDAELSYIAWNNLATLALELDPEPEQALRYAQTAYELNPSAPAVTDTLGWVLVQSGNPQEGLAYLREAYTRASREPTVRYHLAVALHQLRRSDEARQLLYGLLETDQAFAEQASARALLEAMNAAP
jgi:putative PEP-CTERM system TPR-repeat lipoprotein